MVRGRKSSPKSSQYKGVYWHKRDRHWAALIYIHGVKKHIGEFKTEADAARAYDARARSSSALLEDTYAVKRKWARGNGLKRPNGGM